MKSIRLCSSPQGVGEAAKNPSAAKRRRCYSFRLALIPLIPLLALAATPALAQGTFPLQPLFAFGPDGDLFATEDFRIMRYAEDGSKECYAGCGEMRYQEGISADELRFYPQPITGMHFDQQGALYVGAWLDRTEHPGGAVSWGGPRLFRIAPDGSIWAPPFEVVSPYGLHFIPDFAVDPAGRYLYFHPPPPSFQRSPTKRIDIVTSEVTTIPQSEHFDVSGISVAEDGTMYQALRSPARLRGFGPTGEVTETLLGSEYSYVFLQASDADGNIYAIAWPPDGGWPEVLRIDPGMSWERIAGAPQSEATNLPLVFGMPPAPALTSAINPIALDWTPYGAVCFGLGEGILFAWEPIPTTPITGAEIGCIDGEGLVRSYFDFDFRGPFVLAATNAASGMRRTLARESWASLYGGKMARSLTPADTIPLPVELDGTRAVLTDSEGVQHRPRLHFVSPGQVNLLIPAEASLGPAKIKIVTADDPDSAYGDIDVEIAPVAPGMFSADSSGSGVAAAFALRVDRNENREERPIFEYDEDLGRIAFRPIAINPELDDLYLLLYGTGLRGLSSGGIQVRIAGVEVPVLYAGPQGEYDGLDQVNIGPLPAALKKNPGVMDIEITADDLRANVVQAELF